MLELNGQIDREALAARFRAEGRVQVPDVLTRDSAERLRALLLQGTPWQLVWQAGKDASVQTIPNGLLAAPEGQARANAAGAATDAAAREGDYAFRFASYPILTALLEGWDRGGPHEAIIEGMNGEDMLGLAREVTGIPGLVKADAQATLFAPNHFLGLHTDAHKEQAWRVAYVLNLAPDNWHPDWGGYLQFFDENGDIVWGWRPRFNVLNLFAVPCAHAVSYSAPFAIPGRIAITGWFRDK